MFMNRKMLFTIAALGMGMSAFQTAHAATQACKDAAYACGGFSTGGLLVCAAAAAEEGFNPIADIACSDLAQAARGSCITMAAICIPQNKAQPQTTTLTIAGTTQGAPVDETRFCKGSHRVKHMYVSVQNNLIRRVIFGCTDGTQLTTGPQLGSGTTASCGSRRLAQGAVFLTSSAGIRGIELKCDNAFSTTDSDTSIRLGAWSAGGVNAARSCPEGSYIVGYRAFHGGSSGYLKGLSFLCRKLPG
jgi:hypothetical protein